MFCERLDFKHAVDKRKLHFKVEGPLKSQEYYLADYAMHCLLIHGYLFRSVLILSIMPCILGLCLLLFVMTSVGLSFFQP